MKTYDYIIRVSRMGNRREGEESTMTVDDQRRQCCQAIEAKDGRVGREHTALNQSGSSSADSTPVRAALRRAQSGDTDGIAVAYDDRLARAGGSLAGSTTSWRRPGPRSSSSTCPAWTTGTRPAAQ